MVNKTKKQLMDAFASAVAEEKKYRGLSEKYYSIQASYQAKIDAIDQQIEKLKVKRDELRAKKIKAGATAQQYREKAGNILFGKREKARKAITDSGNSREIWQELRKRGVLK